MTTPPGIVTRGLVASYHARWSNTAETGVATNPATAWPDLAGAYDGTLENFAGTGESGWSGTGSSDTPYALSLDGVDDRVDIGDLSVAEGTTLSYDAWFRATNGSTGARTLVSEGLSSSWVPYTALRLASGQLSYLTRRDDEGTVEVVSAGTYNDGNVHHAVVTVGEENYTADGWSIIWPAGGSVTSTLVERDGGLGSWQQLVISNPDMATTQLWQQNTAVGVDWNIGDEVWAAVEFECDAGATVNGNLWSRVTCYGTTTYLTDNYRASADPAITYIPSQNSGVFLVPVGTVPAGTTRLQFLVGGNIAGTWRFGRATMRTNVDLVRTSSVALLGDSITAANTNSVNGMPDSHGYFTWANIFSGHRMDLTVNAGVGGDTTTMMLARIAADVVAHDPDYCIVLGGQNDITGGASHATIVANLEDIYDALIAADITPILCTLPPTSTINTAGEKAIRTSVNGWIVDYNTANPETTLLCDFGDAYDDGDGYPISGATVDGIHPSGTGAAMLGEALATLIISDIAEDSVLPASEEETGELLSNGYFDTTAAPSIILYADGIAVESGVSDEGAITLNRATIGALGRATNLYFWDGDIISVRIHNVALTADEVAQNYALGCGGLRSLCMHNLAKSVSLEVKSADLEARRVNLGVK